MAELVMTEESSTPSTPAANKWKVYFKSDGIYIIDDAGVSTGPLGASGGSNSICDGRLTLESGVPVSVTSQSAKTTVYFTPYVGNKIALYNGSSWDIVTFTEGSVAVPSTTSTPFDVFVYNNSGTATLETVNWTNDTTRATALVKQDGVYVKSGATTRRYLGTGRTTTVSGQCEDSVNKRFLWNYYNRVNRNIKTNNTTASWTYGTHAWREWNNGTGQVRGQFIVGVSEEVYSAAFSYYVVAGTNIAFDVKLAYDATNGSNGLCSAEMYNGFYVNQPVGLGAYFAAGYHYITLVEDAASGSNGTNYGTFAGYEFGGALYSKM